MEAAPACFLGPGRANPAEDPVFPVRLLDAAAPCVELSSQTRSSWFCRRFSRSGASCFFPPSTPTSQGLHLETPIRVPLGRDQAKAAGPLPGAGRARRFRSPEPLFPASPERPGLRPPARPGSLSADLASCVCFRQLYSEGMWRANSEFFWCALVSNGLSIS